MTELLTDTQFWEIVEDFSVSFIIIFKNLHFNVFRSVKI